MMDCFSPTFRSFLSEHKMSIKHENFQLFTHWIYINFQITNVFIGYDNGCKRSLHLNTIGALVKL